MTIREATEKWVGEWNAIPQVLIAHMINSGDWEWEELTPIATGDSVYIYHEGRHGVIIGITESDEPDEATLYTVETDDGEEVQLTEDRFDVDRDDDLPMWGTMWTFGDSADDWWLENGGLEIMAAHGLRIYYFEDLGYCFGVDGAGYSFYDSIWVPLYKARGLQWHDEKDQL